MIDQDAATCAAMTPEGHQRPEAVTAPAVFERRRGGWIDVLACFAVTGGLAGVALALADALELRPWVLFLAWVGYGLLGASVKDGGRLLAGFVAGAVAGMVTTLLGSAWGPWLGGLAMPVALGLSCGLLASLEKRPPLDAVPACFLGMISFFASGAEPSASLLGELAAPAGLGVLWGWSAALLQAALERQLGGR